MAIKTFTTGEVLTASDTNTYLANAGLVFIKEGSATSGGSLPVDGCFTSTYDNYRLVFFDFQPATAGLAPRLRLRVGGVDATGSDYNYAYSGIYTDGTSANDSAANSTSIDIGMFNSTNTLALNYSFIDVTQPAKAVRTFFNVNSSLYVGKFGARNGVGEHNLTTAYDGFTVFPGAGNFLNIKYKLYGYRQA